jgi:hypothetical protein
MYTPVTERADMTRTACPDPNDSRIAAAPRELDGRISDGVHVQLLWHPHDGRVSVTVNDTKTAEAFELEVRDRRRALDVFHHPYAYDSATRDSERGAAQPAH